MEENVSEQIRKLTIYMGQVEETAKLAYDTAKESRHLTVVTEERMKSIQHRLDGQERRLDSILTDTKQLAKLMSNLQASMDGNTKLTKGILSGMKALVSILGFITAILSIVKLIFI